jgi:hypothetical protein
LLCLNGLLDEEKVIQALFPFLKLQVVVQNSGTRVNVEYHTIAFAIDMKRDKSKPLSKNTRRWNKHRVMQ